MTKSRKMISTALSAVLLCALALSFITSYAWLSGGNQIEPLIDSSVITQYFESGKGTAAEPFIIHTPRHMYNFAWLQYMGQFNEPDPDNSGTLRQYYFELCDGTNEYAHDHNDSGLENGVLDMTGWTLPPVGTPKYPFVGHLEGHGLTIANLTVSGNYDDLTNVADDEADFVQHSFAGGNNGCDIVGLFGVVGYMGLDTDSDDDGQPDAACSVTVNGNSYTYSSAINSISNIYIEDITVTTNTGSALAGLAAGYVNGTLSGVAVVSGTVTTSGSAAALSGGPTDNISDYTIVGYCEEEYKSTQSVVTVESDEPKVEIARRSAQDDGNAWGGSIDMKSLHDRMKTIYGAASSNSQQNTTRTYNTSEIYDIDETNGGVKTLRSSTTATANRSINGHNYYYYLSDWGSYNFDSDTTSNRYFCLFGENKYQTKTVTTYTHKGDIDAVYFSSGGHYLSLSSDGSRITDETSQASASKWAYDDANHLYTIIDGTKYYLNYNGVGTSGNTVWTYDDAADTLTGRYNNTDYYAVYESIGGWDVTPYLSYYRISDGSGHYLNANAAGVLPSAAESTKWYFGGTESAPGNIFTLINGTRYYLNVSGSGLIMETGSGVNWIKNGDSLYCTVDGVNYYLSYDNGAWRAASKRRYTIADGGRYLSINNNNGNISNNVTNQANATTWEFSDGRSGTLYNITNSTTRYLVGNDNGTLSTTTNRGNATIWENDGDRLFYTATNGRKRYLDYNNGWTTVEETVEYYTINDHETGVYLNWSNGTGLTAGTEDNATKWVLSNTGNNPYGTIHVYGSNNQYLYVNGGWSNYQYTYSLAVGNTNNQGWNNTGNKLYRNYGGNRYIVYNGGWGLTTTNADGSVLDFTPGYSLGPVLSVTPSGAEIDNVGGAVSFTHKDETRVLNTAETTMENVEKEVREGVFSGIPTYFPINGQSTDPFEPNQANTGYIVSGTRASYQYESGDIRISWYNMSDLSNSLNQNAYSSSRLQVLTQISDSGLVRIDDEYNNVSSSINNALRNISAQTVEQLGLEKYQKARQQLEGVFNPNGRAATQVYGMHFMDALIDMDYLVTAKNVIINGKPYSNYELPQDSIDFTLPERGFINFFAGTYYLNSGYENDSFFSLHEISRDEQTHRITAIREIDEIYEKADDPSAPYVYKYVDEGNGWTPPDGYTVKFKMNWVKHPQIVQKALYYYEIPVNEGEYALGSVDGGYGAYLVYLDISANAQILHRQDVTETVYKENVTCEYPVGVALSDSFTADTDSAAYRVSSGGTVALERSGSDATVSSDAAGEAVFIGEGVSLTSGGNAVELVPLTYNKETYRRVSRYDYNTVTRENTKKVILTTVTDTDGTETRTYTVNGESADGDDGAEIERGTLGLKYHYILPGGVTATDTVALSGVTETGYAGVTTQQYTGMELGAEPIDVTAQMLPIAYAVTIDVADGSITVNEDVISTNHSAEINGQFTFTAGDTLVLPTRSRALSVRKGAMSVSPPKSVQLVPDTSTGTVEPKNAKPVMTDETEYFWDVFSDMSLETWIRDPASFDAIADILTAGGDECDALWERIDAIEDEETYLTVCARIDDIFARLDRQDEEDEGTDLLMLSDEEFCELVTDPMMREILMELLSDAESEQYAELYRRTELIVSDRLFFRAYDHLKRLEQGDGRYAWSLMTDEEFAEWLMYPAEPAELAQLLWYPESEEGAALTERIWSVRDREKRGQCAERIKQLLRDYPPPVTYFWSEMTDEEFAEWICDEEAAEYVMMLLADAQSDETAALLEKAALMEAGEDADRVSERIEELTGELVRLIPWIFMNDEELLLWLADDENTGFIREVLTLPESDAALMLADRIDAMESDELRNAAFERLAALAAVTEDKYTLPDMTDAELIALLGENREAVKMLLAERGMEAYNALLERIRAMEGEEDRAQAEALLDLLIAQEAEDAPPEGVPDDNEEKPPEGSTDDPGGDGEEPPDGSSEGPGGDGEEPPGGQSEGPDGETETVNEGSPGNTGAEEAPAGGQSESPPETGPEPGENTGGDTSRI